MNASPNNIDLIDSIFVAEILRFGFEIVEIRQSWSGSPTVMVTVRLDTSLISFERMVGSDNNPSYSRERARDLLEAARADIAHRARHAA